MPFDVIQCLGKIVGQCNSLLLHQPYSIMVHFSFLFSTHTFIVIKYLFNFFQTLSNQVTFSCFFCILSKTFASNFSSSLLRLSEINLKKFSTKKKIRSKLFLAINNETTMNASSLAIACRNKQTLKIYFTVY